MVVDLSLVKVDDSVLPLIQFTVGKPEKKERLELRI